MGGLPVRVLGNDTLLRPGHGVRGQHSSRNSGDGDRVGRKRTGSVIDSTILGVQVMSDATGRVDGAVQRLGELLEQSGRTVGVAESLTGGLLVQALARHEGSGEWLAGGVVAYRRSVKHDLLAVSVDKVVSEQAAAEMATSVRERLGCDVGVAVTGVAGPDWQDGERPGTVWVAVDVGHEPVTELIRIHSGSPEEICQRTVIEAIMLATRELGSAPGVDSSSIDPHAPDVDRGRRGGRAGRGSCTTTR